MFGFPQQMAALRELLGQFVTDVFASTRFDQQVQLRGIYFTSGTQEERRSIGSSARSGGGSPSRLKRSYRAADGARRYFIERFLKDVLLAESGLAGVNRRLEVRKAAAQLAPTPRWRSSPLAGVLLLSISYVRNRDYLTQVGADVARLAEVPPIGAAASLEASCRDSTRPAPCRTRRTGAQACAVGDAMGTLPGQLARQRGARRAYAELDGALLPQVAARIKESARRLRAGAGETIRVTQGLPDARPARASRQSAARIHRRSRVEEPRLRRHRGRRGAVEALREPAAVRGCASADRARSVTGRTGAQHDSPGLDWRAHLLGRCVSATRPTPRAPSGWTRRLASAPNVCSGAGAAMSLRQRGAQYLHQAGLHRDHRPRRRRPGEADCGRPVGVGRRRTRPCRLRRDRHRVQRSVCEKDYIAFWDGIVKDIQPVSMGTLQNTKDVLGILAGPTSPLRRAAEDD